MVLYGGEQIEEDEELIQTDSLKLLEILSRGTFSFEGPRANTFSCNILLDKTQAGATANFHSLCILRFILMVTGWVILFFSELSEVSAPRFNNTQEELLGDVGPY